MVAHSARTIRTAGKRKSHRAARPGGWFWWGGGAGGNWTPVRKPSSRSSTCVAIWF